MRNTSAFVLRFNTPSLLTTHDLVNGANAIEFSKKENPSCSLIVLHGYFANSDSKIQKLAEQSLRISRSLLETRFQSFQDIFLRALARFTSSQSVRLASSQSARLASSQNARLASSQSVRLASSQSSSAKAKVQLENVARDLHSLLLGISAVKEISTKTRSSLLKSTSRMTAILLHALLQEKAPSLALRVSMAQQKMLRDYDVHIVPMENTDNSTDNGTDNSTDNGTDNSIDNGTDNGTDNGIDFLASRLAIQNKAQRMLIWSNLEGLETVDRTIVPSAKPIKELDYSTALEISYLGGSFFHPQALSLLQEKNIPITIHNQKNPKLPLTTIRQEAKMSQNSCVAITHQKDFVMLTVRSPQMFHCHGYLEKIFAACTACNVSVETLTTSEITVTMTFRKKYLSQDFLRKLKRLGTVEYCEKQVLISVIGKNYWKNASRSAALLQKLHPLPINMISLGQNSTNLGLVLDQKHLLPAVRKLHEILF